MGTFKCPADADYHNIASAGHYLYMIVTSFCCRLYGMRRAKNKLDKIKKALEEDTQ